MNIGITVRGQVLSGPSNLRLTMVEGSKEFIYFTFDLDVDWQGLTICAQFIQQDYGYNVYLDSNNTVAVPPELENGRFYLVLYGVGGDDVIATSTALEFMMTKNMFISDGQSVVITPSLYEQLVEMVSEFREIPEFSQAVAGKMLAVNSGGTAVEWVDIIDNTLAVAGKAADAKKTGDEIADVKNMVAPAYSTSATYSVGDYVIYNNELYKCKTAISTAESWTSSHWIKITSGLGNNINSDISDLNNDLGQLSSLTTEGKDSAVDAINELNEKKADTNGSYDDMTVGGAKQLLSNVYATESSPYIFRASGGSLEIGDREQDTLVGMDLVWNQLVQNGNFASDDGWSVNNASYTVDNNIATFTATAIGGLIYQYPFPTTPNNHKYLATCDIKLTTARTNVRLRLNSGYMDRYTRATTDWQTVYGIYTYSQSDGNRVFAITDSASSDWDAIQVKNCMLIDLTAMFGSTIADYINSLESGTAGAGVAWVKRYLTKDYYPYSAPNMQNGVASSHETTGFNQWDEEWEVGGYNIDTGAKSEDSTRLRSKNFISVFPNTNYYVNMMNDSTKYYYLLYYDSNQNYIGNVSKYKNASFTTPTNASFITFYIISQTTYNHDICINFHYDGERDGEYEPYIKHSYPLDDTVDLHGIPKIDASGNLYADGDTYEADGTVTRKYSVVDLGDQAWQTTNPQLGIFWLYIRGTYRAVSPEIYITGSDDTPALLRIEGYETVAFNTDRTNLDKICWVSFSNQYIGIKNTAFVNMTTAQVKEAMSGVKMLYRMANNAAESAEPFQTPQIVDNWGTEEYVTEGVIPIGHSTKYPVNLRSKIEAEPNSPTSDGVYLMQRENGVNAYVPYISDVPTLPSENGTYSLKVTVSGSTKTVSWVSD